MSSSLTVLPLPVVGSNNNNNDSMELHSLDNETVASVSTTSTATAAFNVPPSISSHAVAYGNDVCGISSFQYGNDSNASSQKWIQWKTSLAPACIPHVISNLDGSIVVAATDAGTVALLRGTDGGILATRRVTLVAQQQQGFFTFPMVSFVDRRSNDSNNFDALTVLVPQQQHDADDHHHSNIVLVSGINGQDLNSDKPQIVAQAAKSMNVQMISFPTSKNDELRTLQGAFVNANSIRYAALVGEGLLTFYDFRLDDKQLEPVPATFTFDNNDEWSIDCEMGFRLQRSPNIPDQVYLILCAYNHTRNQTKLSWIDLNHLTVACEYVLEATSFNNAVAACNSNNPFHVVLDMQPLYVGDLASTTLAVAVAIQPSRNAPAEIQVVQVSCEETMGIEVLSQPHVLYSILESCRVTTLAMAHIPGNNTTAMPFAFRYVVVDDYGSLRCKLFTTGSRGAFFAKLGRLIQLEATEEVREALLQGITFDPYAVFPPSRVALRLLQKGLVSPSSGRKVDEVITECLRFMEFEASDRGIKSLTEAAEIIATWPVNCPTDTAPSARAFMDALTAVLESIERVSKKSAPELTMQLQVVQQNLKTQLEVVNFIQAELSDNDGLVSRQLAARSMEELFACLLASSSFEAATRLWKLFGRRNNSNRLPTESLVYSILQLTENVDPRGYVPLLRDVVFPNLTITHELLPSLRAWTCRTADAFDDDNGDVDDSHQNLDSAIFLLEAVEQELRHLQIRIHASFAMFSPFVEKRARHSSQKHSSRAERKSSDSHGEFSASRPNPTLLELGPMERGAMKLPPTPTNTVFSKIHKRQQQFNDNYVDIDDIVQQKLHQSKVLQQARTLGLTPNVLRLRNYVAKGGATLLAKELVRQYLPNAKDPGGVQQEVVDRVQQFCESANVSFDSAVAEYCLELCSSKETSKSSIEEATILARYCPSALVRCRITLNILRAALLNGQCSNILQSLSKDAIEWAAGDSNLRSELEEAARLLLVDDIVRRYCGNAAAELFRVDNPRHAIKLLEFVCRHVRHPAAMSDALNLCDAFAQLSKVDACSQLIQNAIHSSDGNRWTALAGQLFQSNPPLALGVCEKVVHFCAELIQEATLVNSVSESLFRINEKRETASVAAKAANDILSLALEHVRSNSLQMEELAGSTLITTFDLEQLNKDFGRLKELQENYSVYLSLHDLYCPKKTLQQAIKVFETLFQGYGATNLGSELVSARRVCSLLAGSLKSQSVALFCLAAGSLSCRLAMTGEDEKCVALIQDMGVLEENETCASSHVAFTLAVALCKKASSQVAEDRCIDSMKQFIRASALLQRNVLHQCPSASLSAAVSFAALFDITVTLYKGTDQGVGEHLHEFRSNLMADSKNALELPAPNNIDSLETRMFNLGVVRPVLHSHWNLNDGLLLPPFDTHCCCVAFGREITSYLSMVTKQNGLRRSETKRIYSFLRERGANAVALRVLSASASMRVACSLVSASNSFDLVYSLEIEDTIQRVAERSLGGSGTGMTSGMVDSQLALALLLALPTKLAFKVYKSSLPTALLKKDCARVLTLANVGIAGTTDEMVFHGNQIAIGWKRQVKFKVQCERLAQRACWGVLLQRHNIDFDLRRFDDDGSDNKTLNALYGQSLTGESKYVASLLPSLVATLSNSFDDIFYIHSLVARFVTAFGLHTDFAIQKIVEHFLSPPPDECKPASPKLAYLSGTLVEVTRDARLSLHRCAEAVKFMLPLLQSSVQRAAVLRRCYTAFEASLKCGTDYDRLALVLSLYQNELSQAVDICRATNSFRYYKQELESVHRRRDALMILSSFFRESRKPDRPNFYGFFHPLPVPFDRDTSETIQQTFDILGVESSGGFDPLKPLDAFLSSHNYPAVASGLSPLCLPLCLPAGYIHARALVWRMRSSCDCKGPSPTFEGDVLPVLNKIRSSVDQTRLAEWCSNFFSNNDLDMLACLESAVDSAITASNEAEVLRQSNPTDRHCILAERDALETVKRIRLRKSALADKVEIKKILLSMCSDQGEAKTVASSIVENLVGQLQELWYDDESSPETVVEFLLERGSLLAANACLNVASAISVSDLRALSCIVKRACDAIADQHSHVHTNRLARRMGTRWLVHGDHSQTDVQHSSHPESTKTGNENNESLSIENEDDDDTVNFVMDLASLGDDKVIWASENVNLRPKAKFTCDEEPAILDVVGSSREASELASQRTSLRIAFVFACARSDYSSRDDQYPDETAPKLHAQSKVARMGLLPLMGTRRCENVMDQCRELLSIVFATEDRDYHGMCDISNLSDSRSLPSSKRDVQKTVTFAMKHRALRVASILCPQDALETCIKEEGIFSDTHCCLKKCVFGVFVAKEVEEMKLSLPHSDLLHLSEMHHPTYARTLWRCHRSGGSEGNKGRLLLLLLEMSLRDDAAIDAAFLGTVLKELARSQLPRSTLLACESLIDSMGRNVYLADNLELWNVVMRAMSTTSTAILTELQRVASSENEHKFFESGAKTARRLYQVFRVINEKLPECQEQLCEFITGMIAVVGASSDEGLITDGVAIARGAITQLHDKSLRERFQSQIAVHSS